MPAGQEMERKFLLLPVGIVAASQCARSECSPCVWPILPGVQDLPPATALAVSSLHPCVTDLWRDLILMGLVLTHTT